MKKLLCLVSVFAILLSFFTFACEAAETGTDNSDELSLWEELESLGMIEEENGIRFSIITMPAEFSEGATQEAIDASAGESYTSAILNEDGSVTYRLTEEQHMAMMDDIAELIDGFLQQMTDGEDYSCILIQHSDDYSVYNVQLNTDKLTSLEVATAKFIYQLGGIYGIFTGHPDGNISVRFFDFDGNYLGTANSEKTK